MSSIRKDAQYAAYEFATHLVEDEGFRSRLPIHQLTVAEIFTRWPRDLSLAEAEALTASALEIIDIERDLGKLPPLVR